jgi:threonine aldolase
MPARIRLYLDDAQVQRSKASSMTEYCGLFGTVSLCFSEGPGATLWSRLAGSKNFIKNATSSGKSIGVGADAGGCPLPQESQ